MMRTATLTLRRAAAGGLICVTLLVGCDEQNAYVPPPPPEVTVAAPMKQPVMPYMEATGNAAAYNQVDLVARISGYLQEIEYKDGAVARRGDTLFVIEPAPYQAKLQQAQAALMSAEAQATQSDAEYQRQASLGARDFASKSAVDQALATRDANRGNVLNQKAAVSLAQINLGYTNVTAPFDGIVTTHQVDVGSLVGADHPTKLATIIQIAPIYVSFTISEQDVLRIRSSLREQGLTEADLHQVPVEAGLMTESGYPHKGTVDYISPNVDTQTGTLMVRAILPNPDYILLPGYFVRVRVPLRRQPPEALLVPETALGIDQSGRYLLVVDENNQVQQRTVKLGGRVGALRVVEAGLEPTDRVVIGGLQRAVAGSKVTPKEGEIKQAVLPESNRS